MGDTRGGKQRERGRRWSRRIGLVVAAVAAAQGGTQAASASSDVMLASRASGPAGAPANGSTFNGAISLNGRYVAFDSTVTNLTADSTNNLTQVYVRDLRTQTTILASRANGIDGAPVSVQGALFQGISGDGQTVIFSSPANLAADDSDGHWDAFARNLRTGVTTLVSRADGINGANTPSDSYADSVSRDGRLVVFNTAATDPFAEELYVRNLVTGTTTLASRATGRDGAPGDDASFDGQISADGRYLTWYSLASNLDPENPGAGGLRVYWRDLWTGVTKAVSPPGLSAVDPSIAGTGRIVAFDGADASGTRHIYMRDTADPSGSLQIVDRASGPDGMLAQPVFYALTTSVAPDGRAILFQTAAFDLVPGAWVKTCSCVI